MNHGIQSFFDERTQSRLRVSLLSTVLGLFFLGVVAAFQIAVVRETAERIIPVLRFGVPGPERVVPLVRIDASIGTDQPLHDVGQVILRAGGGGRGGGTPQQAAKAKRVERPGPPVHGLGDAAHDLVARALAGQGSVPIFQSEELVIERLVRPEYPETARERGIEGKVSVLALVDTLGKVIDAEVMRASGELLLDEAAEVAVRQCLFRPYRQDGATREVYAVFRFAFRLN